jgi:predicted house-cleaning NTP pyrophosphatase (Maf/HAM1 superfamily)
MLRSQSTTPDTQEDRTLPATSAQSRRRGNLTEAMGLLSTGPERIFKLAELEMQDLGDPELDEYLETGGWEGKAGAFGLQDRTGWIDVVEGSESNVVGLPLELLGELLSEYQGGPRRDPFAK